MNPKENKMLCDLSEQLAAEQENVRLRGERMQQLISEHMVLRQQLDAEKLELFRVREQLVAAQARCYNDGWVAGLEAGEKQLAAERERLDEAARLLERVTDKGIAIQEQLAAEREKVHRCEIIHRHSETIELLKEQLAAELEKQIICPHCGWEFVIT